MRFFLSTLTSKSVVVNLEVWMNYINLQKQSSRSKYSNTTTAGFKCVGKWGGGGRGVPRLLCLSNSSRCYVVYLAKNGLVALSSKRRRHSVFNFSVGRRKNKALVTSPLLWLFRSPAPTNIDWRQWCQKDQWKHDPILENCHLSGYQKRRQQHKP